MKIGVDAREFIEKGKTGISRYLENLLTPLTCRSDLNFVLFVNRPEFIPESLCAPSVKIVVLPALPTLVLDQVALPCLARREKADVFFSPYYKVPLSGQFKRIITVHDIMFLRQEGLNRLERMLVVCQLWVSTRKADVILVDSDFTRHDLLDFMPNLQPKIRRLYPALGSGWLEPVDPAQVARIRKTYAGDNPFILYVGNFKPHKNVDLLVRAFAQLAQVAHTGNRRLLLVGGDVSNQPRIETLIRECGLEGNIRVYPHVSDADLRPLYAAADWFITPSGYEGFGYPVLEAMASGCPVICYVSTSLPEVVNGAALEISGLTVQGIMNALLKALNMPPAEKLNLVERGKNQAKRFLPGSAVGNFAGILSELA